MCQNFVCKVIEVERFNPLNAELNPIRHLLALVGARHIVHVTRIRVNAFATAALLADKWLASRTGCFWPLSVWLGRTIWSKTILELQENSPHDHWTPVVTLQHVHRSQGYCHRALLAPDVFPWWKENSTGTRHDACYTHSSWKCTYTVVL